MEKISYIIKRAKNVKIFEKICFLTTCKKHISEGVSRAGQNFTKNAKHLQIFFLNFMHKKKLNFASRNTIRDICISN